MRAGQVAEFRRLPGSRVLAFPVGGGVDVAGGASDAFLAFLLLLLVAHPEWWRLGLISSAANIPIF